MKKYLALFFYILSLDICLAQNSSSLANWPFSPIFKANLKMELLWSQHSLEKESSIFVLDQETYPKLNKNRKSTTQNINTIINHSSHVKGIIKQVNPKVIIESTSFLTKEEYLLGLQRAVDSKSKIINISAGGFDSYDSDTSHKEKKLLTKAQEKGKIIIVAAGNDNADAINFFPAAHALDNMIIVASHGPTFRPSSFSNWGKIIDIYAPGENILSTPEEGALTFEKMSGTSQSTPFVSGLASLLWSNFPNLNYHQIKKAIIQGAATPLSPQQKILNPNSSYKIAKKMSKKNNDKTKK